MESIGIRHCEFCLKPFEAVRLPWTDESGSALSRCPHCDNISGVLQPRTVSRFDSTTEYEEEFLNDYYDVPVQGRKNGRE
jgi:hypothetical protein